jgi:class 3 adenylate cyclase
LTHVLFTDIVGSTERVATMGDQQWQGECEVRDGDLAGLAVHIAARVSSLAGPSEVLVSRSDRLVDR